MSQTAPKTPQPKIVQRLVLRTLVLILLLALCIKGYQWWQDKAQDIGNLKPAETVGWIAAVQIQGDGQQAITISPDGKITLAPGWATGKTDRDVTWNPSGNRVFFVSDRADNNFQIFRWNPTDGSDPGQRTIGTRSHGQPQFPRQSMDGGDDAALITSGGFADQYVPKDMSTLQLLPPEGKEVTTASEDDGGGQSDQFSGIYSHLGTSFRVARWCKDKQWIAAIMRRDDGEMLVLQYMTPDAKGEMPPPEPVITGEHIDFDVNPADGTVVFSVQNAFIPTDPNAPEQSGAGKAKLPFKNVLASINPPDDGAKLGGITPIGTSLDDSVSFGSPVISPNGASVAFLVGPYKDGAQSPEALATAPISPNGIQARSVLLNGKIHEPSWSPDGDTLVFAQDLPSGKRALVEIHKDGSGMKDLTGDSGNFASPVFSPQKQ